MKTGMKFIVNKAIKVPRYLGSCFIINRIYRVLRALVLLTHHLQHIIEWGARADQEFYGLRLD
jgi:hypothetical protein